jgi:sec-independent protein translocase protein TatB
MFGLSTWEILIVLVMALIFIGPDQLPKVARKLGEGMRQVRGAMTRVDAEVRTAIREATADEALAEEEAARRKAAALAAARPAPTHEHDGPAPAAMPPLPHNAPVPVEAPADPVLEAEAGGAVVARRPPVKSVPRSPKPVVAPAPLAEDGPVEPAAAATSEERPPA